MLYNKYSCIEKSNFIFNATGSSFCLETLCRVVYRLGITVYACNICEFLITLHFQFYLEYKNILMINVNDVYLELTYYENYIYLKNSPELGNLVR